MSRTGITSGPNKDDVTQMEVQNNYNNGCSYTVHFTLFQCALQLMEHFSRAAYERQSNRIAMKELVCSSVLCLQFEVKAVEPGNNPLLLRRVQQIL